MKLKFPWNIVLTVLFSVVLGIYAMGLVDRLHAAQLIPMTFPDHDVSYMCTPTDGISASVRFNYTNLPSPHFDVFMGNTTPTGDSQNPVITSITNSAGVDVTNGAVKLLAANNGLPITVKATDDTGIVGGRLDVDGKLATPFGNGFEVLPPTFYVRWNSTSVSSGVHNFRLTVWDATQNKAERTWSMTK